MSLKATFSSRFCEIENTGNRRIIQDSHIIFGEHGRRSYSGLLIENGRLQFRNRVRSENWEYRLV